jgi:hypothetical protein
LLLTAPAGLFPPQKKTNSDVPAAADQARCLLMVAFELVAECRRRPLPISWLVVVRPPSTP